MDRSTSSDQGQNAPEGRTGVRCGSGVYIAPTAYVGGDVWLGDQCTVMHHAVIRGDIAPIRVGDRSNVQDGAVLHTRHGVPLEVASDVAIAHRAVVHGRRVGPRTLIGIGAILLDGVEIEGSCIIAAGAVVTPNTQVEAGQLLAGVPARPIRRLTEADLAEIDRVVASYVVIGPQHASGAFPNVVPSPKGPLSLPPARGL